MSETFTKIGGYIASGDALVYGDANTISGSGTVADPFGVKTQQLFVQAPLFTGTSGEGSATSGYIGFSGYNETVLWSGNHYWWTTSSMQVSEPLSGFERIKIYARDDWELPISIFEVPGDATSIHGQCQGIENNKLTIKAGKWTVSGNTITLNDKLAVNCTPGSSPSWTTDSSVCFIQFSKIVGINRKQ